MAAGYLLLKRCCTMIGIALIAIGFGQPLYAQSAGACPCFNEHQLGGIADQRASEDEGLRRELAALAGPYGIALGSDELTDEALGKIAGGLLPAVDPGSPKLQTTLLSPRGLSSSDKDLLAHVDEETMVYDP